MAGRKWSDAEIRYLKKRVEKDRVHPKDVALEIRGKFEIPRTEHAVESACRRYGIDYYSLATKEEKKKIKGSGAKEAVRRDTEKHKVVQQLQIVTSKYKVLEKEKTIGDRMVAVLRGVAKSLPKIDLAWKPDVDKPSNESAVLLLGDLHIGEIVRAEDVYGLGEYNFDVFTRRMKYLAKSIKSIATKKLKGYKIDKLHIFGLGDMVSGRIHEELIENAEDIIFQVLNGAYVTAQFILELSQVFPEIELHGVLGNHGRLTKKVRFKRRYTNWDFVFYQFLSTFLIGNDRIKCHFPKSFFLVKEIRGWNFLVMHGDSIRSWMRIPWYGIERAMWRLGDLLQGRGIDVHYRILGHFHNTGELDRTPGELIINGSVVGGNEFSLISSFEFSRPTQLFFGIHKDYGVTWRYPLRLDLPDVHKVKPYKYSHELDAGAYLKGLLKDYYGEPRKEKKDDNSG